MFENSSNTVIKCTNEDLLHTWTLAHLGHEDLLHSIFGLFKMYSMWHKG